MYLILLKIFIHDLVANMSSLSIKSVVGAKPRGTAKNGGVVRYNVQAYLVNWFYSIKMLFQFR